jgi:hypothetical protein
MPAPCTSHARPDRALWVCLETDRRCCQAAKATFAAWLPSGRVGVDNNLGMSSLPLFVQLPVSSKSTAGFNDVESERWRVDFATRHCFREAVLGLRAPLLSVQQDGRDTG